MDTTEKLLQSADQLRLRGFIAEAAQIYEQVLMTDTDNIDALIGMGDCARGRKNYEEAGSWYGMAADTSPESFAAQCNLGAALKEQGRSAEALQALRKAHTLNPESIAALHNLGLVLTILHRSSEAIDTFEKALSFNKDVPEVWCGYGAALLQRDDFSAACDAYRYALKLNPASEETLNGLGLALYQAGDLEAAREVYCRSLKLNFQSHVTFYRLGNLLRDVKDIDNAILCFSKAVSLKPDYREAITNLGEVLQMGGYIDEAETHFRSALRLAPDCRITHDNLLFCMNYNPLHTSKQLFQAHREWGKLLGGNRCIRSHDGKEADPDKKLRIGYVSPDIRAHPASYFLEPLLREHDQTSIDVICYFDVANPDKRTEELKRLPLIWKDISRTSDNELHSLVVDDHIDILVDCAGHCAQNRLSVFATCPAPVQVSFIGYPNTTGLEQIHYRFTDSIVDPPEEESVFSEELVYLDSGFCSFSPPSHAPDIGDLPALKSGKVTFGSLHPLARLNTQVISLWSSVLKAIPHSQLLIVRDAMSTSIARGICRHFGDNGIPPDRIMCENQIPPEGHLSIYKRIDIALDTLPWSGHTTACEGLWMGVPVVTLRGDRHAGRMVASVLHHCGLKELIADSAERFCAIAGSLSADLERLSILRKSLRDTLRNSKLCDARSYARSVERAYRKMWHRWCDSQRMR